LATLPPAAPLFQIFSFESKSYGFVNRRLLFKRFFSLLDFFSDATSPPNKNSASWKFAESALVDGNLPT
jgi:hypothetical protein